MVLSICQKLLNELLCVLNAIAGVGLVLPEFLEGIGTADDRKKTGVHVKHYPAAKSIPHQSPHSHHRGTQSRG